MTDRRRLGAILYPGFELLDVYGPLEMFGNLADDLEIVVVSPTGSAVKSAQWPSTSVDCDFESAPRLDLLLLPGGIGTLNALTNEPLLEFLRKRAAQAEITMSVCSGSAILAKAGLLDGRRATSNKQFFSLARGAGPGVDWVEQARWVDDGEFVTSSGVSAGIDMALAVIERLWGSERAEQLAALTEYEWHRDASWDPFVKYLG